MNSNDLFISWEEFHHDTRQLAAQLAHQQWRGIVAIARGGLIPAAILARELDIRLVDTLCIASYDDKQQGEATLLKTVEGDGEGLLIVDDLVDTGKTAVLAREILPKGHFVCVYAKPAGEPLAQNFVRQFSQDTWLQFPWDSVANAKGPAYATPIAKAPNDEIL